MKRTTFLSLLLTATLGFTGLASCSTSTPNATNNATDNATNQSPSQSPTASATPTSEQLTVFVEDGIAIRGADPVAYFTQSQYVPGSSEYTYEWMGATWQFASAAHRDQFAANPEQYAPQYGGFCAWAVSQNKTAPVEPTAWKIVDGKLYLNFNQAIQQRWEKDIPGNIDKANQNWPAVLEQG
jgi:YHS domain-containing protein